MLDSAPRTIVMDDTTLRDGEQSAGVAFTAEEKLDIAQALDAIGVPELEVGIPSMGAEEREVITAMGDLGLSARMLVWSRLNDRDLALLKDLPLWMVDLSAPVSDLHIEKKLGKSRQWLLDQISRLGPIARDMGLEICIGGEDSSRADVDFLLQVLETAQKAGARRFRYADTLGISEPRGIGTVFERLRANTDLELEIHAHDDLGLATANSHAAVLAGATHVNTTVNGIGERAGNAPLEEVALGLERLYGFSTGIDYSGLRDVSALVARASGRAVGWHKSVVGEGVFTHEAGVHVDGLLKDRSTYEGFAPELLGRHHRFILGKHSGTAGLIRAYEEIGVTLSRAMAGELLPHLRCLACEKKRSPTSLELLGLLHAASSHQAAPSSSALPSTTLSSPDSHHDSFRSAQ